MYECHLKLGHVGKSMVLLAPKFGSWKLSHPKRRGLAVAMFWSDHFIEHLIDHRIFGLRLFPAPCDDVVATSRLTLLTLTKSEDRKRSYTPRDEILG